MYILFLDLEIKIQQNQHFRDKIPLGSKYILLNLKNGILKCV